MPLYERQYSKILSRELIKALLTGKLPSIEEISRSINSALSKDGAITYKFIKQAERSLFNHLLYNQSMKKIKFDVDLLHEEMLDLFQETVKRFTYADLFHKVHSHELNNLKSKLDTLLFTTQNADFYFLGAFDNFTDTLKTDLKVSTASIVDLAEQALALPYGGASTQKVKMSHLYGLTIWPVDILQPEATAIVNNGPVINTSFGDIFTDTLSPWAYSVTINKQTPVEIRLRFPIAGDANERAKVLCNRLEIIPHSSSSQKIVVSLSNDNVNFITPIGYEDGIVTSDQRKTYALDFDTTLVQTVELKITKDSPDAELPVANGKNYQYIFGIKNFSALTTGRLTSARYQSKPFDFEGENEKISKVSIEAEAITPPGCNISYSVALAGAEDNLVTSFIPIKPIGKIGNLGTSEVVNFRTTVESSNRVAIALGNETAGLTYKGKTLYKVGDTLASEPIPGSSKLYRGLKLWYRDSSKGFDTKEVTDNYIYFGASDTESLYDVTSETLSGGSYAISINANNQYIAKLTLSKEVYYDPNRGHSLKPDISKQRASVDIKPNYAIYRVQHIKSKLRNGVTATIGSGPFGSSKTQGLPVSNFILFSTNAADNPLLQSLTLNKTYIEGTDFEYEIETFGNLRKPTGRIKILDGGGLVDNNGKVLNISLSFTFTHDPDITHKVTNVEGRLLTFTNLVLFPSQSDSLLVEYRHVPTSSGELIKSSIKVKDSPSTTANNYYVEGRDYVIDSKTGTIQRIPTGKIPSKGEVYVDYQFKSIIENIETFLIWCNISSSEGAQIKLDIDNTTKTNKLTVDTQLGEALFINTPQGLIDVTKSAITPVIGPGWVQFICRSKNPDANKTYGTNLIDQVIQLRDINKKRVFKENNQYFKEITAFREPLLERTYNHLKINTLATDHTVFAIDTESDVGKYYPTVNFKPNYTSELYNYLPSPDLDGDIAPSQGYETFIISWQSKSNQETSGSKVIVRVDLERNPTGVDGGITPKVFEYKLRASF